MKKYLPWLFPILLAVLYIGLCALNISGPIWFDESYSAYLIRGNFAEIWSMTAVDVHPPLFYFLLKIWSFCFGTSVVALRSMSICFGVVAIILLFRLLRRQFNLTIATIGSFFFTLCPIFIRFGQEMRMYTLVIAIVIAATSLMFRALDTADPKNARRYWFAYAIMIALGMWTHYFTATAWIAQLVYILYRQGIFKRGGWQKFWHDHPRRNLFLQTYGLAVFCFIPWLPLLFQQTTVVQSGFWINPVNLESVANFISETFLYLAPKALCDWILPLILTLLVLIISLALRVYRLVKLSDRQKLWGLLALIFIPPVVLIILSLPPLSPVYMTRYILFSLALVWAFCGTIIGLALTHSRWRKTALCAALLLIICAIIGITNVNQRDPASYVGYTVQDVMEIAAPGEPILMDNEWSYYDGVAYSSDEHPVVFYYDWCAYQYGSLEPIRQYRYNVFDNLDQFINQHDSFWFFTNTGDANLPLDFTAHQLTVADTISDEHYTVYHLIH